MATQTSSETNDPGTTNVKDSTIDLSSRSALKLDRSNNDGGMRQEKMQLKSELKQPRGKKDGGAPSATSTQSRTHDNYTDEANSDNSGTSNRSSNLSLGNNSFGFNFDSDEMIKIGGVSVAGIESSSEAGLSLSGGGIHPKKRFRRSLSSGGRGDVVGSAFSGSGSTNGSISPKKRKIQSVTNHTHGDQTPRSNSSLSNSNSSGEGEKGEEGSSDSSDSANGKKAKGTGEHRKRLQRPQEVSNGAMNTNLKAGADNSSSSNTSSSQNEGKAGPKKLKMRNGNDQSTVSSLTSGNSNSGTLESSQAAAVTESSGSQMKRTSENTKEQSDQDAPQPLSRDEKKDSHQQQKKHHHEAHHHEAQDAQQAPTGKDNQDGDMNSDGGYNTDDEGLSRQKKRQHPKGVSIMDMTQLSESGLISRPERPQQEGRGMPVKVHSQSSLQDTSQKNKGAQHGKREDSDHSDSKNLSDAKREERNAREKDRSFRISQQIEELRGLLSQGGVIVPKGTKSSILTEAANYIRMLQQNQAQSEYDRSQLIQQMQMIGSGALGPQAAKAMRHAAAQNGVWTLGNFGGPPPPVVLSSPPAPAAPPTKQVQTPPQTQTVPSTTMKPSPAPPTAPTQTDVRQVSKVEDEDYKRIFYTSAVAMALASMGGAIVDANDLFCRLSGYSREELRGMTIFNLTARVDLYNAFDRISAMIEGEAAKGPKKESGYSSDPIHLRGSLKTNFDWGLSIALIRGENDGVLKCFCVTLLNGKPTAESKWPILATMGCTEGVTPKGSNSMQGQTDVPFQSEADAKTQYEEQLQREADQYAGISQMLDETETMIKMPPQETQQGMTYTTG